MTTANDRNCALVTGASSGIGAVYADRLARMGYDLILVARNAERLRVLAERLRAETGRKIETLPADLMNTSGRTAVERRLKNDERITMLINNAGIGATAPLLDSDAARMEDVINLNVIVPMRLTYVAAPIFVARGAGTIINIGSTVAIAPEVLNGVYGGTKAFLLAFSRSLHHELADKGVRVQVVMPGATATNFWSVAGTPIESLPSELVMPVEDMVDAALAGLDKGEFATIPSLPDAADWEAFERARETLLPNLSRTRAAERFDNRTSEFA